MKDFRLSHLVRSLYNALFTFSKISFNESIDFFFATVHNLMKDINMIDSCQAHLPVQYASNIKGAMKCDFQQCGILTSVDSDKHAQPPFKLRNSK